MKWRMFLNKDALNALERNLIALLVMTFFTDASSDDESFAILMLSNWVLQNSFSRNQEGAADRLGLELVHGAGYNTYASIGLYDALESKSKVKIPEFFSTHPVTENRRQALKSHIHHQGWGWNLDDEDPLPAYFSKPCL